MIKWTPGYTIDSVEREMITQALAFYQGNKTQTAQSLGIAVRTLDNKLAQYAKDDAATKARVDERNKRNAEQLNEMRGIVR